jgi:hypothetical protein
MNSIDFFNFKPFFLDSVGGKTQIFGLVSSGLILIVIIAVGPLFKTLPNVRSILINLLSFHAIFDNIHRLRFFNF